MHTLIRTYIICQLIDVVRAEVVMRKTKEEEMNKHISNFIAEEASKLAEVRNICKAYASNIDDKVTS